MKKARRVQKGDVVDIISTVDVEGGDFVDFGARVGVASATATSGQLIALQLEGVFEVRGKTTNAFAIGAVAYADANGEATTTAAGNKRIGLVVAGKAVGDAGVILIKLG